MSVRLQAPHGTVVEVSERKAERLKKQGYRPPKDQPKTVEDEPAPKRRGRPSKTTE